MRTGCVVKRGKSPGDKKNKGEKSNASRRTATLFAVGIGPGSLDHITLRARAVLKKSDVIVGYGKYLEYIADLVVGKELISSGMTKEVDRCVRAIELAEEGKVVSVVSSGDVGIYGMAGLLFELLEENEKKRNIIIEVVPGVSSVNAVAACLGAPLMNDFAVISLSNLLTPWEVIEKRIRAVALADIVLVLTNPKSSKRKDAIVKVWEILRDARGNDTVIGVVRNAKREDESIEITTLEHLLEQKIDMLTTIIIGGSATCIIGRDRKMVTRRGYPLNGNAEKRIADFDVICAEKNQRQMN